MTDRSRRIRLRAALALASVAAAIVSIGSCTGGGSASGAEALVREFTEKLDHRDAAGAAALTSWPNAASASITQLFDGLKPGTPDYELSQFIDLGPSEAFFTVDSAWHFGAGKDWSYRVQGKVRKLAVGWRISWDPEVLLPGLGGSRTAKLVRTYAPSPQVKDITGGALMYEHPVRVVRLDPRHTPDRAASARGVADAIATVAPLITADGLRRDLDTAQGKPVTAVTLREDDFQTLADRLLRVPGVAVEKHVKLLSFDRRIDSPLLDHLRGVWQRSRESTAGWAVQIYDSGGEPVGPPAAGFQGPPGPDIVSTVDKNLQVAAEDAVAMAGSPATVVAIQPSTGAVVAVAQNSAADDKGPVAFTGLYPAGESIELFESGTAAARKQRRQDVSTRELLVTMRSLGIGADLRVPGLPEVTGRIAGGKLAEPVQLSTAGSGAVQISPFGMAVAAATISRGTLPKPMISLWQPATPRTEVPELDSAVLERLRGKLAEHPAPGVNGYSAVAGKDQWFMGSKGDLAFAIHVTNAATRDDTARIAARMFGGGSTT